MRRSTILQKIINAELIPGIAINPGTSVETVMEMFRIVKKVLVMTVNPGNAGQMYMPYVGKKITRLLAIKDEMHFELYWDGACSADKILEFAPRGVSGFVLGTSLLFGKNKPYGETLKESGFEVLIGDWDRHEYCTDFIRRCRAALRIFDLRNWKSRQTIKVICL